MAEGRKMTDEGPKIAVGVSFKANLGNYQSNEVSLHLSGVPLNATEDEINALLDTGKVAYGLIRDRLIAKVHDLESAITAGGERR